MKISPEEAAQALREIEMSRSAMRTAVRAHRGHLYLWVWGIVWTAAALLNWNQSARLWTVSLWLSGGGLLATFIIAVIQGRQVRSRIDRRFVAVCLSVLAFGYVVWPIVLGPPHDYKSAFGFGTLLWMQVYVIGGIWFDNFWLWIGVAVTGVVLASLLFFPGLFWGCITLAGAAMIGSGFYVRYFWK